VAGGSSGVGGATTPPGKVWWPTDTSKCKVDLMVVTHAALERAVRCAQPGGDDRTWQRTSDEYWALALGLRAAGALIDEGGQAVEDILDGLSDFLDGGIGDIVTDAGAFLKSIFGDVQDAIRADLEFQEEQNRSLFDQVTDGIGDAIGAGQGALQDLIGDATDGIGELLGDAGHAIEGALGSLDQGIRSLVNDAGQAVEDLVGGVVDNLGQLVEDAGAAVEDLATDVVANIAALVDTAGQAIEDLGADVGRGIEALFTAAEDSIGAVVQKLRDIGDVVGQAVEDTLGGIGTIATDFLGGLGEFLSDPLKGIIGGFFHGEEPRVLSMVDAVYDRILANDAAPDDLKATVRDAKVPGAPIPAIIGIMVIPIFIAAAIQAAFGPVIAKMLQEENLHVRPTLLSLGDAIQAYYRGVINRADLDWIGGRLGYTDLDIVRAVDLSRPQPTTVELADWHHRGLIERGDFDNRLQALGFSNTDSEAIVLASSILPGVQDGVRFAVREAFPGQVAYDGPRGASPPPKFIELARLQGLDPTYARSFWAAHWELPSVTMAFAMYHRRLIDEARLRELLKEQDLAPEWVDLMIAVAFDPLTRVDVRRMYELRVLTAAEVEDAYLDLGYSPENARRLRDFVVADAAVAPIDPTERDLTRADIVGAYADGILTRDAAHDLLGSDGLGFSDDEVGVILNREDIRAARAERKETRGAIVDQAVAGIIDLVALQAKMAAAGYTADETAAAAREVERRLDSLVARPTRADLDRFLKAGLVTAEEYKVEMRRLGYADVWIDKYLAVATRAPVTIA
jgi:uncharacterized protein YjbJ (UPF0337 family)